jgi:hypothetical protein
MEQSPYVPLGVFAVHEKISGNACTLYIYVGYRDVNAITKWNIFSLPRIDDLLNILQGVSHFSSLDLARGYYQMGILESDNVRSAFKIVDGLYDYIYGIY